MSADDADAAVRDIYLRLLRAWNERDAASFAALFADDAAMIGFDGSHAAGNEVLDHLRPIFADHVTAAYVAKVEQIRPFGADGVMVRAIVGMVAPGGQELIPAVNAVQTLVAERRDGRWRIVLFQNTPAQYHGRPELSERHAAALQPLLATGTTLG